MSLKIRRGLEADRLSITPDGGEFIYTTDTLKVYIGDGVTAGGNLVGSSGSAALDPIWDLLGDTLYGTGPNTGTRLAGNITVTRKFLRQTGTGLVSAAPAWDILVIGDIPDLSSIYALDGASQPYEIIVKDFTPVLGTATAVEELLMSLQVPASKIASGDVMEVNVQTDNTSDATGKVYRIYINTSNSLIGATLVATSTSITINQLSVQFHRLFPVISDTVLECSSGAAGAQITMFGSGAATSANVTVPSVSAGFWILITSDKTSGALGNTGIRWATVRNSKP